MHRHFLQRLEFTIDVKNTSITLVGITIEIISDTLNYVFQKFLTKFSGIIFYINYFKQLMYNKYYYINYHLIDIIYFYLFAK